MLYLPPSKVVVIALSLILGWVDESEILPYLLLSQIDPSTKKVFHPSMEPQHHHTPISVD